MKRLIIFVILGVFLAHTKPANSQSIEVMVSILPLAYFVENIGRDKVDVSIMVPPGANPHTYEPTPRQLEQVQRAKMYVKVGSGLEFELVWMDKLISLNKDMFICDSSEGIRLAEMASDPHIWLSPINAMIMATNIRDALVAIDPQNKNFYARNTEEFILKLDRLNKEIKKKLSPLKNRSFIVFHPGWGYFAALYGLEEISVETKGKEPSARRLAKLIKNAKQHKIKIVFISPQFSRRSVEVIAKEIKARIEFIDPLAKDYIENLHKVTDLLMESIE